MQGGPRWRRSSLKEKFPADAAGLDRYYALYERMHDLSSLGTQKGIAARCMSISAARRAASSAIPAPSTSTGVSPRSWRACLRPTSRRAGVRAPAAALRNSPLPLPTSISKGAWRRVLDLLTNLGFAVYVPQMYDQGAMLQGLEDFRAHLGGRLTIMLLWKIGQGLEANQIEPQTLMAAIDLLSQIALEERPAAGEQLAVSS